MQILASMLVIMYRYLCWESHFLGARAFSRGFLLGPDKKGEGIKKKLITREGKHSPFCSIFAAHFSRITRGGRLVESTRVDSSRVEAMWNARLLVQCDFSPDFPAWKMANTPSAVSLMAARSRWKSFSKSDPVLRCASLFWNRQRTYFIVTT